MEKEEIIVELLDCMQKYAVKADKAARDATVSLQKRYENVQRIIAYFCGLANFIDLDLKIEVRDKDGMLYTQALFNRMYYHETMLKVELMREADANG